MDLGSLIDRAIAPFAPGIAADRMASRARFQANALAATEVRRFDAAQRGDRRTSGWRRDATSADSENARGRTLLAWAAHDLVRNNKYAAAAVRQLVATMWGDGISPQLKHPNKKVQQKAQDAWDRWAESKVDGFGDWYGHGKISCREMVVGGEALTLWMPDSTGPDGRLVGLEGPQLDMSKTYRLQSGKIVQGVEYDANAARTAFWLFESHPNDILGSSLQSKRTPAEHVDHLYERLRFGQSRGASWLGAVAMTLRDVGDIEDAKRLQEKVQACLALIVQPGEGQASSPLGEQKALSGASSETPLGETIRPGMIARVQPGETVQVVNPQPSSNTVEFIRQQIAGVSANMIPYHLMTGDVSQANYSGLRAATNGSYSMIDDWQQNEVIPLFCRPAVCRRMRRLAMETGDKRFLEVRAEYALPIRRMVDPVKDLMGEIMEIRAGLKHIGKGLAERGLDSEQHLREIKRMNDMIDLLGLALDTDPRRLTDAGILQAAAGYIAPKKPAE